MNGEQFVFDLLDDPSELRDSKVCSPKEYCWIVGKGFRKDTATVIREVFFSGYVPIIVHNCAMMFAHPADFPMVFKYQNYSFYSLLLGVAMAVLRELKQYERAEEGSQISPGELLSFLNGECPLLEWSQVKGLSESAIAEVSQHGVRPYLFGKVVRFMTEPEFGPKFKEMLRSRDRMSVKGTANGSPGQGPSAEQKGYSTIAEAVKAALRY